MTIDDILRSAPVIPVLVLHGKGGWVKLAETFVKAGLPVLDVTLRTPAALDAITTMAGAFPAVDVSITCPSTTTAAPSSTG